MAEVAVPLSRYAEWLAGLRPLPLAENDALGFYERCVESRLFDRRTAAVLYARHRRLVEREQAGGGEPEIPQPVRDWLVSRGWNPPE